MNKGGFTLVELLVVIAIIAILTTVGIGVFSTAQKSSKDVKKKTDIAAIAKALEEGYNITSGQYQMVESSDFTSGATLSTQGDGSTKITFPDNSSFRISFGTSNSSFNVCGTLSDDSLYCQSSVRGTPPVVPTSVPESGNYVLFDLPPTPTPTPTPTPVPTCSTVPSLVSGINNCRLYYQSTNIIDNAIYINCPPASQSTVINVLQRCSVNTWASWDTRTFPAYTTETGSTPVNQLYQGGTYPYNFVTTSGISGEGGNFPVIIRMHSQ